MMLRPGYIVPILIVILQIYGLLTDQPSAYHVRLAFFSAGLTTYYFVRWQYWRRYYKREMKKMDDFFAAYERLTAPAQEGDENGNDSHFRDGGTGAVGLTSVCGAAARQDADSLQQ